ncbi:MAG: acyl-CoA thioesterase [Bacteroidales bacterium]|nr:acyl-CoA thioesterase [Candidatus Liminaster caballi]
MKVPQTVILEDICEIPVKFSEIDSMQRAWHGSYVKYMEDGRESFGRHYPGIGYADIVASGIYAPIVDVRIKYYGPLELNDTAVIRTRYVFHPGARLDYSYEIRRKRDDALCARGLTTQLFIGTDQKLLTDKPQYYADWQHRYGIDNE